MNISSLFFFVAFRENFRAEDGGIAASCLPEELVNEDGKLCLSCQGAGLPQGRLQFAGAQEMPASGRVGQHSSQALPGRDAFCSGQGTVKHNPAVSRPLGENLFTHAVPLTIVKDK